MYGKEERNEATPRGKSKKKKIQVSHTFFFSTSFLLYVVYTILFQFKLVFPKGSCAIV
jgi:hypothetical protein